MRLMPDSEQIADECAATERAARLVLRAAGFFSWGHDAWCHDAPGYGCMTTAEALEALVGDDELTAAIARG